MIAESIMIDVTLVGTGGMVPLPDRFLSSCLIEYNGNSILIDCGEGTQVSLAKGKLSLIKIKTILITHCHADHVAGLPGLLLTMVNMDRKTTLDIIVPRGQTAVVNSLLVVCGFLPYEVRISELHDSKMQKFSQIGLEITSIPLKHHINCLGYAIELHLKRRFNPEKAKELNIPVRFWSMLHAEKSITFENKKIEPDMVLGYLRKPIKITYVTDTRPVKNIAAAAAGSDLLICEGMYGDDNLLESAVEKKHMIFSEAASIASEANVGELWLTHFSPSLRNPNEYIDSAKRIFPNTVVGSDLMTKTLKPTDNEN
jgi:ribonuclease Z